MYMNIIELYQTKDFDEKQQIRNEILKICDMQQSTWYSWFKRRKFPRRYQSRIADFLQKPVDELFNLNLLCEKRKSN